jgi:hypothetical protein
MAGKNGNGKRNSLSIRSIDQPQLAEELTWQHRARRALQAKLTSAKLGEYADSVLERATAGDRYACQQLDRWIGVGVPVTINVTGEQNQPALGSPLEDRIEDLLYEGGEQLTTAEIAGRLAVPDADVRRAVNTHLPDRFVIGPGGVVSLQSAG